MKVHSVILFVFLLSLLPFSAFAQAESLSPSDTLRLLANPQRAAHTFVHWQMRGHERFDLAATTMLAMPELSEEEREDRARQLLRILDSRGLLIEFDRIPSSPTYEDSLSGLNQFILFQSLPQIYLEKRGDLWMFSRASVDAIPDLYRGTFSVFVDVVLDTMPSSWHREWLGLAVWQYLALFLWLLSGLVLRKVAEFILETYVHRLTKKTETQWDDYLVESAKKPVSFILMLVFFKISSTNLMFSVTINFYLNWLIDILLSFAFVWLFYGLVNVITGFLSDITSKTKSKLDEQLVPLLGKTLKVFVVVVGVLFIIQNSGYNVASVLAGLGIGGLAVALAARDTLANFFGSVTIFLDKPFQIGHWVNINGQEGIVEEVGFRTTRIRTFYNSLISVPNSIIANTAVDNLGMREYRRVLTRLNITYNTPPEQIEAFVEAIKGLVRSNPKMRQDFMEVHFNDFGPHSLDILVYVFLKVPSWHDELQERHNFFLDILNAAKEIGVEFAFPTQTLHIDSFHSETPREAGVRRTEDELVSSVWAYGPQGDPRRKGGVRLQKDGKEISF